MRERHGDLSRPTGRVARRFSDAASSPPPVRVVLSDEGSSRAPGGRLADADIAGAPAIGLRTPWVSHGRTWPPGPAPPNDHPFDCGGRYRLDRSSLRLIHDTVGLRAAVGSEGFAHHSSAAQSPEGLRTGRSWGRSRLADHPQPPSSSGAQVVPDGEQQRTPSSASPLVDDGEVVDRALLVAQLVITKPWSVRRSSTPSRATCLLQEPLVRRG